MKTFLTIFALFCVSNALCQGQFQNEAAGSLSFLSDRLKKLATAIPTEKYAYTPQQGVRSTAEVFAHIISANYFFGSKIGAKIPADVKIETLEKDLKTKEAIEKELGRSYEVLINAIKNTKDASLSQKVEFPFPGEFTQMTTIMISLGHSNEHLGQLIAYARMNGIVPPWSDGN